PQRVLQHADLEGAVAERAGALHVDPVHGAAPGVRGRRRHRRARPVDAPRRLAGRHRGGGLALDRAQRAPAAALLHRRAPGHAGGSSARSRSIDVTMPTSRWFSTTMSRCTPSVTMSRAASSRVLSGDIAITNVVMMSPTTPGLSTLPQWWRSNSPARSL